MSLPLTEIGWQVVDPDGNVVESGPLTIAHMTAELVEQINPEGN